jgi:2-polyprenyl-3-methyl-5-hydroxy-6-metoxy-1,4-benzoquinol methylase
MLFAYMVWELEGEWMNTDATDRNRIYENYASGFQDTAPKFDSCAAERWGKAYNYYLRDWLPQSRDTAAIVDLACGGGKLLHYLKKLGYTRISGVDISPEQVRVARQVVEQVCQENVLDFLAGHPGSFDCIIGLDIIEHFRKDEVLRFLDSCFAALRPGGRLILQTPNAESPWGTLHRYNDFTHEVCFVPNSIRRLLALCGFQKFEAREQGPVPWGYSAISTVRYGLWQCIRTGMKLWNLTETGTTGSGIFTRVFVIKAEK